ncbi:MAG TPA: lysophospholipase [Gemmatimonadaceae bacterium]|nr:lysophospholipase [Gemmatimonadaceae bacterium]
MKTPDGNIEGRFRGHDGLELSEQTWRPRGAVKGVVAIVHGIGEHSGRYGYLVQRLTDSGLAVSALDNRGHGRSAGQRGHIESWADYREDVHSFLRCVCGKFPGSPLFLYGHSLGALIVSDYVLFYPHGLDGLIVSGHPLQPTGAVKPLLVLIARLLSRFRPKTSLGLGLNDEMISRDAEVVKAYRDDPLVHGKVTARWATEALAAVDRVRARAHEIRMPLLVLHGDADKINSADGSRELLDLVSSVDKQLILYPGGYHEPHNDLGRERMALDVIEWINSRVHPSSH